jgi:hypothetical protein
VPARVSLILSNRFFVVVAKKKEKQERGKISNPHGDERAFRAV